MPHEPPRAVRNVGCGACGSCFWHRSRCTPAPARELRAHPRPLPPPHLRERCETYGARLRDRTFRTARVGVRATWVRDHGDARVARCRAAVRSARHFEPRERCETCDVGRRDCTFGTARGAGCAGCVPSCPASGAKRGVRGCGIALLAPLAWVCGRRGRGITGMRGSRGVAQSCAVLVTPNPVSGAKRAM